MSGSSGTARIYMSRWTMPVANSTAWEKSSLSMHRSDDLKGRLTTTMWGKDPTATASGRIKVRGEPSLNIA
jgi:hypothetical protein